MNPQELDLVGILIGSVLREGNAFRILCYSSKDESNQTERYESNYFHIDTFDAMRETVHRYGPAVVSVWRTTSVLRTWYYVQLSDGWPPDRLIRFSLPWAVASETLWRDAVP